MPEPAPPVPGAKRAFLLVPRLGLDDGETCTPLQEIENMAVASLMARAPKAR